MSASIIMDPLLICPLNKTHRVRRSKMPEHLNRCAETYPLFCHRCQCPYNPNHVVKIIDIMEHTNFCPDGISFNDMMKRDDNDSDSLLDLPDISSSEAEWEIPARRNKRTTETTEEADTKKKQRLSCDTSNSKPPLGLKLFDLEGNATEKVAHDDKKHEKATKNEASGFGLKLFGFKGNSTEKVAPDDKKHEKATKNEASGFDLKKLEKSQEKLKGKTAFKDNESDSKAPPYKIKIPNADVDIDLDDLHISDKKKKLQKKKKVRGDDKHFRFDFFRSDKKIF